MCRCTTSRAPAFASGVRGGDRPPVAVLDEVGGGGAQLAVVAAGDDRVAGGGGGSVGQGDLALPVAPVAQSSGARSGLSLFEGGEPVGAGADVQLGGQLAGGGEHDRVQAGGPVGGPGGVGLVGDGGQVADVDPVVVDVEPEAGGVAGADGQAGGGFGLVAEPDQLGEGDGAGGGLDVAQDAAGGDGGQLPVVADEADAGAPLEREPGHRGQVAGGGHAGLVDDDQGLVVDGLGPRRHRGLRAWRQLVDELGEGVGVGAGLLP